MPQREHLRAFLKQEEHLRMLAENGEDGFMKEFMALKQQSLRYKTEKTYPVTAGEQEYNMRKNRYKDILPFDYTRLILSEADEVEGSDYINANYILGVNGSNVYIAAQGPLPHTVIDFWRMLWASGVEVVIMACNEYESGKHKCEKYWADENDKKNFGDLAVTLIRQLRVTPDFLIRTLKVNNKGEERVLNQFHYTAWPDHGVPKTVQPIMDMIQLFREYSPEEESAVVIHCSAGCGRTGTIICIDYVRALLKAGKIEADFCLYDIIMEMRKQRPAIVQTRDQYELVHRAVAWLFRKELGLTPNPNDFDHHYENVKLQMEQGPRMPPGAGNLIPDKPQPSKLSPKQRRSKYREADIGHNYVNHIIAGKGVPQEPGSPSGAPKTLKPPLLPMKQQQQQDSDHEQTIYVNLSEKTEDGEEDKTEDGIFSPTLKSSPVAQERFESGYKKTLAAFKDFDVAPVPQARSKPPESKKMVLRPKTSLDGKPLQPSQSFDSASESQKPTPPSKPSVLSDKPSIGDKPPGKVSLPQRPNLATKPEIARKKEIGGVSPLGKNQPSVPRKRPTSEPVNSVDPAKGSSKGAKQFQQAKNTASNCSSKPEMEPLPSDGKATQSDAKVPRKDNKGNLRPVSVPTKPLPIVLRPVPISKPAPVKPKSRSPENSPEALSAEAKSDTNTSFAYEILSVSPVKLQSHKEIVDSTKTQPRTETAPIHHRPTIDPARPPRPLPERSDSAEYSYATQQVNIVEKLKEGKLRPQLKTGVGLAYSLAYNDGEDHQKDVSPNTTPPAVLSDYSYASGVMIPMAPSGAANIRKYSADKTANKQDSDYSYSSGVMIPLTPTSGVISPSESVQSKTLAYEVIEIGGIPSEVVPQDDLPVFTSGGDGHRKGSSSNSVSQQREKILSSGSVWGSFTDDESEYACEEEEGVPPLIPEKTSASYEIVDGEDGSGASSKQKISQFLNNQREKLITHKEKLANNPIKGFLNKIGDAVTRSTPTTSTQQSSPPSSLSSSPQATIVSDLNEIIKRTLRDYEPTYNEGPTMYNNCDISFPKRVAKPKRPPSPPANWIKSESASLHL